MLFDELLLTIMKAVNLERTISSPYHLLKGKKSGQTLQDIGYYQLYPFFAVMPHLDKEIYDRSVQRLLKQELLKPNDEVIELTPEGQDIQVKDTSLNGWKYRGKEMLFFQRLSLIVQSFSHISQSRKVFDPVINANDIQLWVKNYLKKINYREPHIIPAFKRELFESLKSTPLSDGHKTILLQRLSGAGLSGMTWEQIAHAHSIGVLDAQLQMIEMLHGWLTEIEEKKYPLLAGMMDGIIQESSLTETAKRTKSLFEKGFSLDQIASLRQLKTSTIEDHFVELAMNDPEFDYRAFVDPMMIKSITAISRKGRTKRLRDIKEQLPEASYFQIRLALAIRGDAL